ncbi:MAG: nitrate reductase NapAB chaperone NapD [Cellvibrionaceae bacterium]|jgi:nitrate reductase NapAB chaperone NapD
MEKFIMIIKSYLVYPVEGKKSELEAALNLIPACEVTPATNQDLLILVTETADDAAEELLETQLHGISSLQALTLVSGHSENL